MEIKPKPCQKRDFATLPKSIHTNHSRNNHNSFNINSFLFQTLQEKEERPISISNVLDMLLSFCCVKTVDNKLFFINCPVHRQDPNERTAWPKEIRGANVCTIAKGEEIQKISAAILFSSQQPANTYSRSASFCALIQKVQSTGVNSKKFTLTQEIFSFPPNGAPNEIIRFHPSFLQQILHT